MPRPAACASKEEEYFPCCIKCAADADATQLKETLAHRSAIAEWLTAEWCWDFGFTLPEELVSLWGIGITKPELRAARDRVFVLTPDLRRSYLQESLQKHANLKGDELHEAKLKVDQYIYIAPATFPNEIAANPYGQLYVTVPRNIPFGQGQTVAERYSREAVEMRYDLPILVHGSEIVVQNGKVSLMGVALN